jgi:hypothetical protein
MKKILLSALCAFSTTAFVQAQVAQMPIIEHFTQASCGPCASQNPTLYGTLGTFGSANYAKITYQTSWPGVDPMNAEYAAGPNDRRLYYGVSGVPNASLNGAAVAGPNTAVTSSTLATAAALMTPYDIAITQTWVSGTSVDVTVVITNTSSASVSTADRFHLAMVEENITFSSAPGSNGETAFFNVVRDMYNASTGASSTAGATIGAIPAGGNITFTLTGITPPSYIRDLNQVSFVGYVQNNGTQEIFQGGKTAAGNVPGLLNVGAAANSTVGAGYCDYTFTPAINFTNNGTIPVTTVTGEYTINGGTAVPVTVGGLNLMSGQSTAIAFPATTLPATGSSTVQYNITDVNAGGTYSGGPVAMDAEVYAKLPSASSATPIVEGFQGLAIGDPVPASGVIADNPNAVRAFAVNQGISGAVTWNLGGHGASDGCFRWDFYDIPTGNGSQLVWEKLDLTTSVNSRLSFSRAHALYGGSEPDRLKVNVSTDCGATWTTVWDKQGTNLTTAPAVGNARFYPSVAQWVTDTIDLTAYDGATELVIAFEAISGYGNCLYLDDVNTFEATSVGVSTINVEAAEVRIMPNPVSNNMTLEFTMLNTADANINIVNALGQQVQQVTNGSFSGTNVVEVNTSNLAAGVYFVNITTKEGTTTERFIRQ